MNQLFTKKHFALILFPVCYALFLRILFGLHIVDNLFSIMSISFLFVGPLVMGVLTTYFADKKDLANKTYIFLVPWIPLYIFFGMTILLKLEGWACWIMVLPVFMLASSIGGYLGAYIKNRKNNKLHLSLITILPLLISPLENQIESNPTQFKAYNTIEINASAENIWNEVTQVSLIDKSDNSGYLTRFLGFPRPLEAELNYNGVGAYRKAIFTNGLIFHETVIDYIPLKKMTFTIRANPHEIPSTTLDEHITVGGKYFDVLDGTYELEKLAENKYKLHLYSHFVMNTKFNFYAGLWAKWIMKDIQNNILRIEKKRAESK